MLYRIYDSYLRFVTKDRITQIDTAENDWENELVYYEQQEMGDPKPWYSPTHPDAASQPAIMLHYATNRPLGALLGESDLTTMIPWLLRYSRMLEDRVRLHWAVKLHAVQPPSLWLVTVPSNKIQAKREQYRVPPDSGQANPLFRLANIVKDESETWDVASPALHGSDASHDLKAVRGMIDAGSGYPPHWRGESGEANLATATAMQAPTERHLMRRQKYFTFLLQDILFHAYQRSVEVGRSRKLPSSDYNKLFSISAPDISRSDNEALARSAKDITQGMQVLASQLPGQSETFTKQLLRIVFKFAGEPQTEDVIESIYQESLLNPPVEEDSNSEGSSELP